MFDSTELDHVTVAKAIACRRAGLPVTTADVTTLEPGDGSVLVTIPNNRPQRITGREIRSTIARARVQLLTANTTVPAAAVWTVMADPNDPKGHVLLSSPTSDKLVRMSVSDAAALARALVSTPAVQDAIAADVRAVLPASS